MRRVMIVDDEPIIVEGLLSVLSGSGLDIDLYTAGGGEEALNILERVRMDVVISDIRMPGMDGLQLLERIHANWPRCRVIFLSGFSQFDTVYRAIQSPAVTFLLKTEGFDKIIATLGLTLDALDKHERDLETIEKLSAQQALARHMLEREALSSLMLGEGDAETGARFEAAGLKLSADLRALTLYAYVESGADAHSLEEFHKRLIAADQALRAQLAPYQINIALWSKREDLLWLMQPTGNLSYERCALYVRENLEPIQEAARREAGLTLAFALDAAPILLRELPRAFSALRLRVCQGVGVPGMIALGASEAESSAAPILTQADIERMRELLEHQNRAEFLKLLSAGTNALSRAKSMDDPYALEAYMALAGMFLSYINRFQLNSRVRFPGGLRGLSTASGFRDWTQAAHALNTLGEALIQEGLSDQGGRAEQVMAQIRAYIEAHISDPDALSLARIAEKTYFNPSYLSRLYRQTTGETLTDYVSKARMRRANALLNDPKHRIGDVGEMLGFSSSANFARFYRKMTGLTPQEYRDALSKRKLDT